MLCEASWPRGEASPPGVGSALKGSLLRLVFGNAEKQQTVIGARGANESESDNEGWTESSAEVFLQAGKEYMKIGKNEEAERQLKEALAVASAIEIPEIRYYLACAATLNGNTREAWNQLAGAQPRGEEPWTGDFMLLKARLLEEASSYAEAIALLTQDGGNLAQDAQRAPLYFFLLGLGYRRGTERAGSGSLHPGRDDCRGQRPGQGGRHSESPSGRNVTTDVKLPEYVQTRSFGVSIAQLHKGGPIGRLTIIIETPPFKGGKPVLPKEKPTT